MITLLLVTPFLSPVYAVPLDFLQSGENVTLSQNQYINQDYFAAGKTVIVSGVVNGDAYLAGGNIIVDGIVNGSVLAAGGNINIRGRVTNDVRVAGGQINISGIVGGNVTSAGGNTNIENTAQINGSLVAATGNLNINGPVGKSATFGAGQVNLNSTVGGNITAGVGVLTLLPQTKIGGNLEYWSDKDATVQDGAMVFGTTHRNQPPKEFASRTQQAREQAQRSATGAVFFFKLIALFTYLVGGIILIKAAPVFSAKTVEFAKEKFWLSLGLGFLITIAFPIVFILLLVTVLGIPLALMLLLLFLFYLYFGALISSLALGKMILKGDKNALFWPLILGLLVYEIVGAIPLLGWLFKMVMLFLGIGVFFLAKKNLFVGLRSKKLI